jgi:oxygen-dependent protoporphyrinogen oxidase
MQVDAGVDKDLVFGDPTAPRFVWWDKKLRATPSGPDVLTFDLLSLWGKIRAGLGAVGIVKGGPMPGQCTHCVDRPLLPLQ